MTDSIFGFNAPEKSPGFMLWQVSNLWMRKIKEILDQHDITHAQFVILAVLTWLEESKVVPNQSLLIEKTKLDKMTVSKSLKKFAEKNYIKRSEDKTDTRAKSAGLTTKGRNFITKLVKLVEQTDQRFFSQLNREEQFSLLKLMSKLAE